MTHSIKNIAVVFYGQSRTYLECAENIKTFFSTKNPDINIDFICTINAEVSFFNDRVYKNAGSVEVDINQVSENIKNLYNPVHMSTFSTYSIHIPNQHVYTAMLHAMSEKKKYEITNNKYYDLTIVCRYDIQFEVSGSETLNTAFDFLIDTINHHYSIARTPTNNSTGYNLPFFSPNIFVLSFNNAAVPTNWFRPQDFFVNSVEDFAFIGTGCAIDILFSIIANIYYIPAKILEPPRNIDDFKQDFFGSTLQCTHHDIARILALEKVNVLSLRELLKDHGTYFDFKIVRPLLDE